MSKRRAWIVAGLLVPLLLAVRPARAGFYLAPAGTAAADRIVTVNGDRFYVTSYNGEMRPIPPITPAMVPPGIANVQPAPVPKVASLPLSVMLDQDGYITPVKDQGGRGACTIFATVGAIESEYLRQYRLTLDLSEEYLINMINEDRAPWWVGGDVAEKLYSSSYYGLPPATTWPYQSSDWDVVDQLDGVFGVAPRSAAEATLLPAIWQYPVLRDIANYAPAVYPPMQAHIDAIYGPQPLGVSPVATTTNTDPTPLEEVIANGHPIVFMTATGDWQQDPTTGVFQYANNGNPTDHAVLIVGYDHTHQIFRIKNSWSSNWNGDGFADFSYELVLKTMQEPYYVTSIRPPTAGTGGNGELRGFWIGILDGVKGVGVVHHAFDSQGYTTVVSPDAGYFYGFDGSTRTLEWAGGTATQASFSVSGATHIQLLTLTYQNGGWKYGASGVSGGVPYVASGTWCRTVAASGAPELYPESYMATPSDPELYPNVACTPSETLTVVKQGPVCPAGCTCANGKVVRCSRPLPGAW
jgi:hypothetical protein